jgi:integrase/recombinase XerD
MPPATYKAVLRPPRPSDGLHAVALRITKDRKPVFAATGIYLAEKQWNDKATFDKANWVRTSHREAGLYNDTIRDLLAAVRSLSLTQPTLTAAQLRDRVTGRATADNPEELDFLGFFAEDTARHESAGNPRTAKKRLTILRKLQAFAGGIEPRLPFKDLTVSWVKNYQAHLIGSQGNSQHTANKELQVIHTVLKQAIADGKMEFHKDPFLHVRLKHPKTAKPRLTAAEVAALAAVEVKPGTWEQYARDCWLLQFNLQGTRVGDVIELRHRHLDGGRATFTERKTGKTKNIPIHAGLAEVLSRYPNTTGSPDAFVLPFLDHQASYAQPSHPDPTRAQAQRKELLDVIEKRTVLVNRYVKKVAARAGIEKALTSHTARHSFADAARLQLGGNIKAIQEMLNHGQLKTTEIYLSNLAESELDAATLSVYNTSTTIPEHPRT